MPAPDDARLLLDVMLGDLARLLRMCGYDAAYAMDRGVEDDARLLAAAREEGRTLLTRDERLAARAGDDGLLLRATDTDDQLAELADAGFALELDEPARCAACNGALERAPGGDRPDYVPPDADPVWRCPDCGQYYWKGSHWTDVARRVADA